MKQARARAKDNLGYVRQDPRWLCSHSTNFRYVTSSKQLLTKCLPRCCTFLIDLYKLNENEKQTYLELLEAKRNGDWICQEKKMSPPSMNKDLTLRPNYLSQSKPSGIGSKPVVCPNCSNSYDNVLINQQVVFCECEYLITNEAFLEED